MVLILVEEGNKDSKLLELLRKVFCTKEKVYQYNSSISCFFKEENLLKNQEV